jgi:uncharacterized membrane protein YgaE (UPF0421/DUF939 family)
MAEAVKATQRTARRRPAESTSGTLGVVVGAVVALLGLSLTAAQVGAIVVLLGFVPALVTWWRTR